MADALARLVIARLEDLAELGLVTIDTHIRVPPALIRAVADTFDDDRVLAERGLADDPEEQDTAASGGPGRVLRGRVLPGVRRSPRRPGRPERCCS